MNTSRPALLTGQLRHTPDSPLQALAGLQPGAYPLTEHSLSALFVTEPALVELVLAGSPQRFRKAAPAQWRWLVGDGTAASNITHAAPGWDALRAGKRAAIRPTLSLFAPEDVVSTCHEVLDARFVYDAGQSFDAFALFYEAMFVVAWRSLFGREASPQALAACRCLRLTAPAVDTALRAPWNRWMPYFDRSLSADTAWWRFLPVRNAAVLRARRSSIAVLLNEMSSSPPEGHSRGDLPAAIRAWVEKFDKTDAEVVTRFSLLGLLLASFENSAATATWMLWLLARHPEWQERVIAGTRAGDSTACRWCLNETLRLFPPVWSLAREAMEPFDWQGHGIKTGTLFFISPYVQGRLAAEWNDANCFRPQRWEEFTPSRGVFLPFGSGRRACPGEAFARLEVETSLAFLLTNWRFETRQDGVAPKPMFGLTQRPRHRVWLRAWRR